MACIGRFAHNSRQAKDPCQQESFRNGNRSQKVDLGAEFIGSRRIQEAPISAICRPLSVFKGFPGSLNLNIPK